MRIDFIQVISIAFLIHLVFAHSAKAFDIEKEVELDGLLFRYCLEYSNFTGDSINNSFKEFCTYNKITKIVVDNEKVPVTAIVINHKYDIYYDSDNPIKRYSFATNYFIEEVYYTDTTHLINYNLNDEDLHILALIMYYNYMNTAYPFDKSGNSLQTYIDTYSDTRILAQEFDKLTYAGAFSVVNNAATIIPLESTIYATTQPFANETTRLSIHPVPLGFLNIPIDISLGREDIEYIMESIESDYGPVVLWVYLHGVPLLIQQ